MTHRAMKDTKRHSYQDYASSHRHRTFVSRIVLFCLAVFIPTATIAQTISPVDGQAFDSEQFQELTLDVNYRTQSDSQRAAVRFSLPKLGDRFVFFFDVSTIDSELDNIAVNQSVNFSGNGLGYGLFYAGLPDWRNFSAALKLSVHEDTTDVDDFLALSGRQVDVSRDIRSHELALLLSPKTPLRDNGLTGYLSLGVINNRLDQDFNIDQAADQQFSREESEIQAHLAAGLVYPLRRIRLYAVLDYETDISLSLGMRWHVSRSAR